MLANIVFAMAIALVMGTSALVNNLRNEGNPSFLEDEDEDIVVVVAVVVVHRQDNEAQFRLNETKVL